MLITVPSDVESTYHIRLIHTKKGNIMFGIATEAAQAAFRQLSTIFNEECLVYSLYYHGQRQSEGSTLDVTKDNLVAMRVNLINGLVIWSVGQKVLYKSYLRQQLRKKVFYLVVRMWDKNDVVELF